MTINSQFTGNQVAEDNMFFGDATGMPSKDNMFYDDAKSKQQVEQDVKVDATAQLVAEDNSVDDWTDQDRQMLGYYITDMLGTVPFVGTGMEFGTALAANAFWLLNPELRGDKTREDIYNEMLTSSRAEMANWAEDKPLAAGLSSFTGAVMNPATLATGSVLGKAANIRKGEQVRQSSVAADTTLKGRAAAEQAALKSRELAQQYSGVPKAAFNVAADTPAPLLASAITAAEGGALAYTQGGDAGTAAAIGAVVPFGFAALGGAARQVTKPREFVELGTGEDFIPLMYTESGAANLYRTVVGKAFGAQSLTQQQILSFTRRFPALDVFKDGIEGFKLNTAKALARAKRTINTDKDEGIAIAKKQQEERIAEAEAAGLISVAEAKQAREALSDDIGGLSTDEIKDASLREADAAVNATQASFRAQAVRSAAPSGTGNDVLNDLDMESPQEALKLLDAQWSSIGFKTAKNKEFNINQDQIMNDMEALLDGNPEAVLALRQSGNLKSAIEFVGSVIEQSASGGKISGEDLVSLRSRVGTLINGLSEGSNTALVRKYINDIQDYFDDIIVKQLNPKEQAEFAADKAAWLNKIMVEDSVLKATGRNKASQGSFTADDWIESAKSISRRGAARGQAPLQKEAEETARLAKERSDLIKQNASNTIKEATEIARKQLKTEKRAIDERITKIKLDTQKAKEEARSRFNQTQKTAKDKAELDIRLAEFDSQMKTNLADYNSQLSDLEGKLRWITENSTRSNTSLFEQLFSTTILAAPVVLAQAGSQAIMAGTGMARGLAAQSTQRALVGQTKAQRAANTFLDNMSVAMRRTAEDRGIDIRSSTVAAGEGKPRGPVVSQEVSKVLMKASDRNKAAAFKGFLQRNQADRIKAENPKLYKELKSAYDKQQ